MHRLSALDGFDRRSATGDEVLRWARSMAPSAPVKLGLISNPMARTNWRSVGHERLLPLLDDPFCAVSTPSADDLDWALGYLLFQRGCNVLAINGGDGTIHHTVGKAIELRRRESERVGRSLPLPLFLFLNGGGMNMLARTFETRGHPRRTVRAFLAKARRRSLGTLATREVPLLGVEEPTGRVRHGFIFGSEVVLNALTMYERYGQGYRGLSRFFWTLASGYALKTEAWERYGHLLDPPDSGLEVDGRSYLRYTACVLSTVPMTLLRKVVVTLPNRARTGSVNGFVVTATDKGRVLGLIPPLMRARAAEGVEWLEGAQEITLYGPYTIDGERIIRFEGPRASGEGPPRVIVRGTEEIVRGVVLRP